MRHTPGYYGCYNSSVYTGYGASLFQPKYSEHQKSKTKPISGKQPLNSTAKTYFCFGLKNVGNFLNVQLLKIKMKINSNDNMQTNINMNSNQR